MTRSRRRKLSRLQTKPQNRRLLTGLKLAPMLLAGAPLAHAQSQDSALLEEVVVTAQKQQENLQAVPMSIQAFGTTKLIYRDALEQWTHYEPWLGPLRDALGPALTGYPDAHRD